MSLRDLASDGMSERRLPSARCGPAIAVFDLDVAEIRSADPVVLSVTPRDLSQSRSPATSQEPVYDWSFDASGILVRSDKLTQVHNRPVSNVAPEICLEATPEMIATKEIVVGGFVVHF